VRGLFRFLKWTIAILLVVGIVAVLGIYFSSERILHRKYTVPLTEIAVPDTPSALAEGERLARVYGCYGGCHGKRFEGNVLFEEAHVARLVAPNLHKAAARWNNAELARIVRHGVRPNGESVFAMPSYVFKGMSDADLGAILAFLRKAPEEPGLDPELKAMALGRFGLVTGKFQSVASMIDHDDLRPPAVTPREPLALGDYLAHTNCAECHAPDLRGRKEGPVIAPDLAIAGAYSLPAFTRLLREGVPVGGQTLGTMGSVARSRFKYLTDDEIAATHQYLLSRLASK
jgi:mono/diheme cytochrome c family protein